MTFAPRVGGVLSQNVLSFPGQSTSGLTSILDAKQARGSLDYEEYTKTGMIVKQHAVF